MKIKQLLRSKKRWTKGCYARNARGAATLPAESNACCFCLIGAAHRCYPNEVERYEVFKKLSNALNRLFLRRSKFGSIATFNDHKLTTHQEVLRVLKEANV